MALGASGGRTLGGVVGHGMRLVALGVGIGLAGAVLLARSMAGVLYGTGPFDLPAFAAAAAVLVLASVCASLVPARRATRVDPMIALREP
jgi:ABC-type antimicrobial peptide transport system permease subunit